MKCDHCRKEFCDQLTYQRHIRSLRDITDDTIRDLNQRIYPETGYEDEDGYQRDFKAFVADIHKPLGSAAEFSETHDSLLWHDGGALLPKRSPIAVGLRKEYWRLKGIYGDCHEIPLYREGQLYNFYLKRRGTLTKLSSFELSAQEEGGEAVDAGAELSSGNPRQARQL